MDDSSILGQISQLVEEEHRLLSDPAKAKGDETAARLRDVGEQLDQCWDLLRQRRAKREYGDNPDTAAPRDRGTVEGYTG